MSAQPVLKLECARTTCYADDVATVSPMSAGHLDDAVWVEYPEGWGWDQAGLDYVMHCPDHRGPVTTS
jgi:hypothetical protein